MSVDAQEPIDAIYLIHGTFARPGDDEGTSFCQRGSEFWRHLNASLAGKAQCEPVEGTLPRWSGDNSARSWDQGGKEFADQLMKWNEECRANNRYFHIISHSHGGNIVWFALDSLIGRGIK